MCANDYLKCWGGITKVNLVNLVKCAIKFTLFI